MRKREREGQQKTAVEDYEIYFLPSSATSASYFASATPLRPRTRTTKHHRHSSHLPRTRGPTDRSQGEKKQDPSSNGPLALEHEPHRTAPHLTLVPLSLFALFRRRPKLIAPVQAIRSLSRTLVVREISSRTHYLTLRPFSFFARPVTHASGCPLNSKLASTPFPSGLQLPQPVPPATWGARQRTSSS